MENQQKKLIWSAKDLNMGDFVCEVSTKGDKSLDGMRCGVVRRIYRAVIVSVSSEDRFLECLEDVEEFLKSSGQSRDELAGDQCVVELRLPDGNLFTWYNAVFEKRS